MKIQVDSGKLICLFLLTLATAVSSKTTCPFTHLYHFGDGFTDNGNSINVDRDAPNPARYPPYGMTNPGWPSGRWCDGLVDFDFTAIDLGLSNIVPYLGLPASTSNNGVIFSVARSPVLPFSFFEERGIEIPSYAVPLRSQMRWFKTYLNTVCSSEKECAEHLANSLLLMGDIEGNDLTYGLTQGKTIEEVKAYVPYIINEQINASRTLINLGGTRILFPGNGPIGCYPYILTTLWTTDNTAYDELGCLKSVNELIEFKNSLLQTAIENLKKEFPDLYIAYGPVYAGVRSIINTTSVIGSDGINKALKSCCGIGGRYNYDSNRFCGSPGVPVCCNPNEYIFWDGLHLTQEALYKAEHMMVVPALPTLGCIRNETLQPSTSPSPIASLRDYQLQIKFVYSVLILIILWIVMRYYRLLAY